MENKKITTAKWFWRNYGLMLLVFLIALPILTGVLYQQDNIAAAFWLSFFGLTITAFSAVRIAANYVQLRLSDSIYPSKIKMIRNWFDQVLINYTRKE